MASRAGGHKGIDKRRLGRADFLRLIGAGATLPFVSLAARPSNAQTIPAPTPADLVAGGEFPIGAWWPPPPGETNQFRYQQIADAGFNFVIGGNGVTNDASIWRALEAAGANDLKFLLTDDPGGVGLQDLIHGGTTGANTQDAEGEEMGIMQYMNEQDDPASAPDGTASNLALSTVQERIEQRVQELQERYGTNYPALAGINLFDEPHKSMFGRLKFAGTEVREQFPIGRNLPYANVYPSYAARRALGTRNYADYLDLYLKGAGRLPLLSFDHYPLLTQNRITSDYFYNWAAIRSRALRFRIPSWILIQSVGFEGTLISPPRRKPREIDELFWQVNVSLAYGAKGIQYFTYWTPRSDPPRIQFTDALVSESGRLTQLYYDAQVVNAYLRKVGKQLLPLTSELVMHTRVKRARSGVRPFKADGWLRRAGGSPVILGRFLNPLKDTERYLLVANRSLANEANARLTVAGSVVEVSRFDPATETFGPAPLEGRVLPVRLDPGRAELYKLSRVST